MPENRLPLYFLSTLAYFWIPSIALGAYLFRDLDPVDRKAFWVLLAVFYPLSTALEFAYLSFDLWTFSETKDPLLGLRFFGVPIEEFLFWYGTYPFILVTYFGCNRLLGGKHAHA